MVALFLTVPPSLRPRWPRIRAKNMVSEGVCGGMNEVSPPIVPSSGVGYNDSRISTPHWVCENSIIPVTCLAQGTAYMNSVTVRLCLATGRPYLCFLETAFYFPPSLILCGKL